MIKFLIGLLIVMGALGGMDDPENNLLYVVLLAVAGLGLMYWGSKSMERERE